MNLDRFTLKAQDVLQKAAQAARTEGHPEITTEHLALALVQQEEGVVPALLDRVGVEPALVERDLSTELAKLAHVSGEGHEPRFAPALVKILDQAEKVAHEFKDDYVASEHLFLALVRDGKSKAANALAALGPSETS